MSHSKQLTRREFVAATASSMVAAPLLASAGDDTKPAVPEPIIDVHQHTNYSGRTDKQLVAHQRELGIRRSVLLPAGSKFGLAAGCGGNESVRKLAQRFPEEYVFFANELPNIDSAKAEIEKYLKLGAIGIGEQKFPVDCDSPHIVKIAEIAQSFDVPVLLHFQHKAYNFNFHRFHRILKRFPKVSFIGHAQTWWGNIDKKHKQEVMYPKGKVTPGGITDRYLSDYPNMYGDLSAGSGLNSLLRDEDHAREFLKRHQDKLLYGSDCNDAVGRGKKCQGSRTLAAIRRLAPDEKVRAKIYFKNAKRILKL